MAAAKDGTEEMRERLLTRDTVFLGRSTKKALLKFQSYVSVALGDNNTNDDDVKVKAAAESMRRELKLLELEVQKAGRSNEACAREMRECDDLEAKTTASIEEARSDIVRLQEELGRERRSRERKEEYEALAKLINAIPSRESSRLETEALATELSTLEAHSAELGASLQSRSARYDLLLQTVDDLERSDLEDAQAGERRRAEKLLKRDAAMITADDGTTPAAIDTVEEEDGDLTMTAANDDDEAAEEAGEIAEEAPPSPSKRSRTAAD